MGRPKPTDLIRTWILEGALEYLVIIPKHEQFYVPSLKKGCVDRMSVVSKKSTQMKVHKWQLLRCLSTDWYPDLWAGVFISVGMSTLTQEMNSSSCHTEPLLRSSNYILGCKATFKFTSDGSLAASDHFLWGKEDLVPFLSF